MNDAIRETLDAVRERLRSEFLGHARLFLFGLELVSLKSSELKLRAPDTQLPQGVIDRIRVRLADEIEAELGTRLELRILRKRNEIALEHLEPLVDEGNGEAMAAIDAILDGSAPSKQLFLYGCSGVGKSYWLRRWMARQQPAPVVWQGEELADSIARLARTHGLESWHNKQLEARAFAIDEIHRVRNKPRVQRELCLLLDDLEAREVPVLLMSRHHPRQIWDLQRSLSSRFLGGWLVAIDPPKPETRRRFLRRLGIDERRDAAIFDEVDRVGSYADLIRVARRDDPARRRTREELVEILLTRAAHDFGFCLDELCGTAKPSRRLSLARQVAVYVVKKHGVPASTVARRFKWRSPSTASYALRRVAALMKEKPEFRARVEAMFDGGDLRDTGS